MLLVSRHGEEAVIVAEHEAARFRAEDDPLTSVVWDWIGRASAELLKTQPGDDTVH